MNILLPILQNYFKEMMSLEGKIFVLDSFVKKFRDGIKKREIEDRFLMGALSTFRDISKETSGNNLYNTGYRYELKISTLESEIDTILSKEYCLALAQSYEIFESYLVELFVELLSTYPNLFETLKLPQISLPTSKSDIKIYVKEKIGRRKNNRDFIKNIRKMSQHFKDYETKNIYNLNTSAWFDLVSELRHNITHNRQVISNKLLEFLKDHERGKLFEMFFERKITNDGLIIFLTNEKFHIILDRLNEFAFFIFKSLSIAHELDNIHEHFE